MTPRVESRSFAWDAPEAKAFFDEHGYVVVDDVLQDHHLGEVDVAWDEVVSAAAALVGMSTTTFVERFPQNRDLWRKNARFRALLFETAQNVVVRRFLAAPAVRLFHDHAICKPASRSETIPWHQDSAYWPLDRVGISVWTPTADVSVQGGCLKVLDGSHHDGPGAPQDFLTGTCVTHDADERLVLLPVKRGQSVVLDGLTWHGSDPNVADHDRLAYLTLWVPSASRYVPEHASWHPSSAHIRVAPGAPLDGEYFPLFGDPADGPGAGRLVAFPLPVREGGPSMFTASKDIAAQMAWLRGIDRSPPASLAEQLDTADERATIARRLVELGIVDADLEAEVLELLSDLRTQEVVRRVSVARDVYLRTTSRWWQLAGTAIDQRRRSTS